jgi:hypothetical protein
MSTTKLTEKGRFEAWLRELDDICIKESGLSYRDLPNQNFKAWYQGGMTPKSACYQMMQSFDDEYVYYQEFDDFTDADPGL